MFLIGLLLFALSLSRNQRKIIDLQFEGKLALVTGSTAGIGFATDSQE
jgi:hypothetical protein